eukprot:PLAT14657.1.p1 GENE.PLAT14657.1~~PLAT14657.1.p1  ORF type:complete len:183 (+),score=64.19 PLAT14657.1:393-941(+)
MAVVWERHEFVQLSEPYIPGFLAFREVEHLVALVDLLREQQPLLMPQVILVDGNGVLHPRGFGLAAHLGVLTALPTIGVGKTLLHVDGLTKGTVRADVDAAWTEDEGATVELVGDSGRTWGAAFCRPSIRNPVFISTGHRVSLDTALQLVAACSNYRIPEPVRQADLRSRVVVRERFGEGAC